MAPAWVAGKKGKRETLRITEGAGFNRESQGWQLKGYAKELGRKSQPFNQCLDSAKRR